MVERQFYKVNFGKKKIIIYSKMFEKGYEAVFCHEGMLCLASVVDLRNHPPFSSFTKEQTECMIFPIDAITHKVDYGNELYVKRTDSKDLLNFLQVCIKDVLKNYHSY